MIDAELDDYEGLLASPGWQRVLARFDQEWGASGAQFVAAIQAMANTTDKAQAAERIQHVIGVQKGMASFFTAIQAHVQALRNARMPVETGPSRRGVL